MKNVVKLKSKYTGCMLGAAIGDALGKQNEGLARKDILNRGRITDYGKAPAGCPGEKLREGQYTDDTEQMLVLARSLIECRGFEVSDFSGRLSAWGKDALNDPLRKSLIGPASASAIVRLNSGMTWEYSGSDIPSCGSAMRVAPIGLFYKDPDDIEFKAAISSVPTHNSKGAIAGAVAVAVGAGCALSDMDCGGIIKEACSRASNYDVDLSKKIKFSYGKRDYEPDEVFSEIGTSYLVYETVPSAFYCFSRHFDEPENAILEAVNAGGDTDSIACITGALCGALHGATSFPEGWIRGLENGKMIEEVADMLFEISLSRR
ncbi:ADP-ribosylglycohydrolase [uncultured archaeon]|nr:ADP-ribosylglycohydrolase [uncultured archaeon]